MKFKSAILLAASLATSLLLLGCYSSGTTTTYPRSSAGTAQTISKGTVLEVRSVNIEGRASNVGYTSGAILGGAVGQTVGSGDGRILASAGAAVVGGIVGLQVEKAVTADIAQEIVIEMENGSVIVVVQQGAYPEFIEGDEVEVIESSRGQAQVRHRIYGN